MSDGTFLQKTTKAQADAGRHRAFDCLTTQETDEVADKRRDAPSSLSGGKGGRPYWIVNWWLLRFLEI